MCRTLHQRRHRYWFKRYCVRPAIATVAIVLSVLGHPLPIGRGHLYIGYKPATASALTLNLPHKVEELSYAIPHSFPRMPTTTTTVAPPPPPPPAPPKPKPVVTPPPKPSVVTSITTLGAGQARKVAVSEARRQIGKPYRWGGNGPSSFDCSGLMVWAWKAAGEIIPRTTFAQWRALPHVPLAKAEPGDLVFLNGVNHVGMVSGEGMMIEAAHPGTDVREVPIRSDVVGVAQVVDPAPVVEPVADPVPVAEPPPAPVADPSPALDTPLPAIGDQLLP